MYLVMKDLLANMAVVAAVITVWANIRDPLKRIDQRIEKIAFGLVMSGGALVAIMLSMPILPGVILDLRVAPLAVAGFFGGPLAAVIAAVPSLVYRAALGGDGALGGCMCIVLVAGFGVLERRLLAGNPPRHFDVIQLAVGAAAVDLLTFLALPPALILPSLMRIGGPAALLDVTGVILAGLSLMGEQRRRQLIEANALYRAVIEALPDCLNVKDLDGRFIAANPATARLMRAPTAEALIGKTDFDFYPEPTAQQFRSEELAILAAEQEATVEQQATFADGAITWLSTLKVPFRGANSDIVGLITHNRDVTSTRNMQSELDRTRQHLADALANMADGVVMYDSEATILLCNEQYRSLFPLTAELRVPGARLPDVLRQAIARGEEKVPPNETLESWIAAILKRVKTGGTRMFPMADGRWIEARNRLASDGGSLEIFADVTARKEEEEMLRHRAEHDPLTGLPNRGAFEARLLQAYARALKRGSEFAVMLVDLDQFKQVNDTFGHKIGDHLLVNVARRLEAACRHGDHVARLGGDEFAVISEGYGLDNGAPRLAQRILDGLATPFEIDSVSLLPGGSIGFTIHPGDSGTPDALVTHADEALYAAKAAGRRRWVAYRSEPAQASAG